MRHLNLKLSDADAALLGRDPAEALGSRSAPKATLQLRLSLATVTPVLGGGVKPFLPTDPTCDDDPDPVRVPAIRGQLRTWARWTRWPLEIDSGDLQARREREVHLWGGVLGSRDVHPSRVRLSVENVQPGKVIPAGVHRMGSSGPKALPDWENVARGLGYALFPLQAQDEERRGKRTPVSTLPVRLGLRFDLVVTLLPGAPEQREAEVQELLGALWAWVHLGGIGARTRRGFGALQLERPPTLSAGAWTGSDFCPTTQSAWLAALEKACAPASRLGLSSVMVQTRRQDRPERVHGALVELLRSFRQGPGQGRGGEGGATLWPEAGLLRWRRISKEASPIHLEAQAGEVGLPRAAFGLPLEIGFKDQKDRLANASVRPPGRERLASRLLIRPLVLGAATLPMALILQQEPGARFEAVDVHFKEAAPGERSAVWTLAWRRAGGARRPVSDRLRASGGDALAAFQSWLARDHQFATWRSP